MERDRDFAWQVMARMAPTKACAYRTLFAAGLLAASGNSGAQVIELSALGSSHPGFRILGIDANDSAGESVAGAGDVNGDGLMDLIVGAPAADPGGPLSAGEAYVVFGKTGTADVWLSALGSPGDRQGFRIDGIDASDRFAFGISAAGDVNGDGLGDLIAGARFGDPPGQSNGGETWIVFGKTSPTTVKLTDLNVGGNTLGFRIDGDDPNDGAGASVSGAGDINGDGLADLVIGAPGASIGVPDARGEAYVVFGKTDTSVLNLSGLGAVGNTNGFRIAGVAAVDGAGSSVSGAGDVNGDGLADVIIGAAGANPYGRNDAGSSYVVFGKTDNGLVLLSALGTFGDKSGFRIDGIDNYDASGTSVAGAGDVNGDGLADVVIGAHQAWPGNRASAGETYVVFGKSSNGTIALSALGGVGNTDGFRLDGVDQADRSGRSAAGAGDVNGDGLADVIVGAYGADPPGRTGGGETYVVYGKSSATTVALSAVGPPGGTVGFRIDGPATGEYSGFHVAGAGDVNGDGLSDVVVGAPFADAGASDTGIAYVVFSPFGFAPLAPATTAKHVATLTYGDVPRFGVGAPAEGADSTLFPDSRLWVDFDAGSGPGLTNSSQIQAFLTRNDAGIVGLPLGSVADVQWAVDTNRVGWSVARVTARFTNAEMAGLSKNAARIYTAPSPAGPFVQASNHATLAARNEVSADITLLPSVLVVVSSALANGDANDDGEVDVADVTAIHNFLAGLTIGLDGDGDVDNDLDVDLADAQLLGDALVGNAVLP